MDTEQLYKDIKARTHGEIYIGVVGPVRTGKSTFIKRFMDVMVLPRMEDEHMKEQTRDELPQSAAGKTIMTTEPKFVPKDAAVIHLNRDVEVKVRLIDCVGYLVKGASGYEEAGHERMVKTPWYQEEIPFTKAAVTGTQKVIREHATIGIVVTTDGTITDIPSDNYEDAEARTIRELQSIRKPFVVLVNSKKPHGQEAKEKVKKLEDTYQVRVMTVNCEQIKEEDIYQILEAVLYEFPVSEVQFYIPKWVEMLPVTHKIKQDLLEHIQEILGNLEEIKDAVSLNGRPDSSYIKDWYVEQIQMDTGCVIIRIHMYEKYYYEMLSEMTGTTISGQYDLIKTMKKLSMLKNEYENVEDAFTYAESREEEAARLQKEQEEQKAQAAGNGQAIVDYACQFIGNPYVWGGTSLTNGADCSGFVQSVFAHFGIALPRTTWDMENAGTAVSYDQAVAGDIILYNGHVGIYMGNGQIVNAINSAKGIGILPATYTNIVTVRRLI